MMIPSPVTAVAENVYQVRLPLPFALNIVNCYLLDGGADGWTVVDSGLNHPEAQATWNAAFAELGITPAAIRQIVLTHIHPDHYGMAGWLQGLSGAPVLLDAREYEAAVAIWGDEGAPGGKRESAVIEHLRRCGAPDSLVMVIRDGIADTRQMTFPHPTEVGFIAPGDAIRMGGRSFRAIHAPGHSDHQLMYFDAADRLLLSGDHVLMKITPNIGLWPEAEPHPLASFVASLHEFKALDVRLALPGHKTLITDWQGRLDELLAHHEARLALTRSSVEDGARTVYEVAQRLFPFERLSHHEQRFALMETLAHLDYLETAGALRRHTGAVWNYSNG